MVRFYIGVFVVILLFPGSHYAQKLKYTKRSKNEVREGPGNYYPMLYILPPGVPIEIIKREDGWNKFRIVEEQSIPLDLKDFIDESETWISKNCLIEKAPQKSWKNIEFLWDSPRATPSSIAAAIRGYARRYGKTSTAALDSLIKFQQIWFTPQEYLQFKNEMRSFQKTPFQENLSVKYSTYFRDYDITVAEEGIGLGVAARVAGKGLLNEPQLLKYINLLGTLLADVSGAYDFSFKIMLLQGDELNAVAIPGGYIFITKAMINICRDEAELAGIIAHEMMHVVLKHGLQEIQQRIMNIKMDLAMQELEEEIGKAYGVLTEELDDLAIEAYELVVNPRLQSYEEEADLGSALFLSRAGYDPKAVPRMVLRLRDAVREYEKLELYNPFAHLDFEKRHDHVSKFIKQNLAEFKGVTNTERFLNNTKRKKNK